ncbi:MAG: class I SAM-dependent methyltransferase [Pseudomonadota bacterium]
MEAPVGGGTSWSREQIEDVLKSESFNYQSIALPYGLTTGGHDRSSTAQVIMPESLSGQSFIDVGCSLGYFCFEARRRGAGRVVGLDFDENNIRKGRILADILGESVEFQSGDIESAPLAERFDQVICLNVLHHLSNPILGLDRLIAATRRRLVLEMATFGSHDRRKLGMGWLQQKFLSKSPALLVGRGTSGEGIKQFYITQSAVENLMRYGRGCFASVEIRPSAFKERFLVIAHKHDIGNLAVVGFPTSSATNKTLEQIAAGAMPEVASYLGLAGKTPVLAAPNYHEPQPVQRKELIFQYDIMRPFSEGAGTLNHDPALDITENAGNIKAITVWIPRDKLSDGIKMDIQAETGRTRKRLTNVLDQYDEPSRLIKHYSNWFQFLAHKKIEQRVLCVGDNRSTLMTVEEWQRSFGQ